MITLEEYKKYLLNVYKYKIDGTPEKFKKRGILLANNYSDDFLSKVISDTYEFTKDIFNSDTLENGYCDFEIDKDTSFGIDLMITGGGYSDTLLKDSEDKIISKHILETIFGKQFYIDVKCKEIERECEEDIVCFDYNYSLYMQGFPNNLKDIKEKLFGKEKVLIK